MLKIHFLLRKPKRKGRKAIYVTVRYQRQTVILYPHLNIHSDGWISKPGISKPRDIPENEDLKDQIYNFEKLVRATHLDLQRLTPGTIVPGALLKKAVNGKKLIDEVNDVVKIEKQKPLLITVFLQTMIDHSKSGKRKSQESKQLTPATISTYETTKKHFEDFQAKNYKKYSLLDIDQKLIDGFSDYLTHDLKMAFNGAGKYMKTFRTMLNYARQLKLIGAEVLIDNKIKVTHETPDNIYLTTKEISDMMELKDFDTPLYEVVRDLFVIGCKTGLRYSDYAMLSKARIDNDFIYITQKKTQSRVTIPIHPIVKQMLSKYPDGLPAAPPNQVFNRYLKEIAKKLPQLNTDFEKVLTREGLPDSKIYKKYEIISSHSSRRSFATNEYLNGTPTITIMAITGHKSEKSFLSYIKADSLQHAMLMRDRWNRDNNDMETQVVYSRNELKTKN